MELNTTINFLSVLIAAVASFVFGWLWYGPLFGKTWARENKIKGEGEMSFSKLLVQFITVLLTVLAIEILFTGSIAQGFALAVIVWIGFLVANRLSSMLWMRQSWTVFFIDAVYHLANLILIVAVLNWM